ncbi:FAD-binding protein [Lactobacillus sp. ESL0791]|uniref:FAD-binding protein n=1 Tax=Lactobacillus sp. ESL0791 TaxID=2983234 RepID=UPI0023F6DAD6|nr:FAD-binding protein [Lactobacillus sp. ESL0791]MDF7638242.1 FAD-binding protein [Lactobacillus sp. ESL0791]
MIYDKNTKWDVSYDVIVLGFGGAGATAARFAADAGARVLLVDSAPEGHEGGNTRYCGQLIMSGSDQQKIKEYFINLTKPMSYDEEMVDVYTAKLAEMPAYVEKYLGVKPVSVRELINQEPGKYGALKSMTPEYPELSGAEAFDFLLVHRGFGDAALWKKLRQEVIDRSKQIDVWFNAPAQHLIKAEDDRTIIGVQIERGQRLVNVKANNGVVLTLGGFENNQDKVQNYIGEPDIGPIGTVYNTGKGIDLAIEANADLWHMQSVSGSMTLLNYDQGQRAPLVAGPEMSVGSIIQVGDDGTRYHNEAEPARHGYWYNHGLWRQPQTQAHPYLIFDQAQYTEFANTGRYQQLLDVAVKALSLAELAGKIGLVPDKLEQTVKDFNDKAAKQDDAEFHRPAATMRPLAGSVYYAVALKQAMLNTQGGPRRNSRAEVVDTAGQPVPHLYAAGELGSIWGGQYQGGGDISDCLIFGKIAGENAAAPKTDNKQFSASSTAKTGPVQNILGSDIAEATYSTGKNQYLGESNAGMGDEIIVRVTVDEQKKIKQVEVLKHEESPDYGLKAIEELPKKMVAENTYDVDAVSGASASSRGIKEAVKNALDKVK